MFYYVRGELVLAEPGTAVIDCGGVGYKLSVSDNTLGKISNADKKNVLLYTYMYIREDAVDLIGFATQEELSAFKMLISVSGVGPKAAMSILSLLSSRRWFTRQALLKHPMISWMPRLRQRSKLFSPTITFPPYMPRMSPAASPSSSHAS